MKVGTDLCDPRRIEKTYEKYGEKFLDRVLTNSEKEYVLSSKPHLISRLAVRYAAKEAVSKLLGTGIGKDVNFHEIEITKNEKGVPGVKLSGAALRTSERLGLSEWSISLSHEESLVVAMVAAS